MLKRLSLILAFLCLTTAAQSQSIEDEALTASDEGRDAALPIARELVDRLNDLRGSQ